MAQLFRNLISPTVQAFLSGSGTYTTPAGVLYLKITMVGGGGGGGASYSNATGSAANNGLAGGNTTFGTSLLVANGGTATTNDGFTPGLGGTASLGSAIGIVLQGASGVSAGNATSPPNFQGYLPGGEGASTPLGGAGSAGQGAAVGGSAIPNTGSGGGGGGMTGAGTTAEHVGAGGSAGGYVCAIINSPATSYSYAVGLSGAGGTGGENGGAGGSGSIVVEEYYQ